MTYGQPKIVTHPQCVLIVFIAFRGSELMEAFEALKVPENVHKQFVGLKEFKQFLEVDNGGMYDKGIIVTAGNVVNQISTSGFQHTLNIKHTTGLDFERYATCAKEMLEK